MKVKLIKSTLIKIESISAHIALECSTNDRYMARLLYELLYLMDVVDPDRDKILRKILDDRFGGKICLDQ